MRPVKQDSGKEFMRTLSQTTTGSQQGIYNDGHEFDDNDNDIFTTDVVPHSMYSTPTTRVQRSAPTVIRKSQRPSPPSEGMSSYANIVPYHEAVTHFPSQSHTPTSQKAPGNTNQPDVLKASEEMSASTRLNTQDQHSNNTQADNIRSNAGNNNQQESTPATTSAVPTNLKSIYQALDVLSSVTPLSPTDNHNSSNQNQALGGNPNFHHSDQSNYSTIADIPSQSTGNYSSLFQNNDFHLRNERGNAQENKIMSTSSDVTTNVRTDEHDYESQLLPLDEFYFNGSVHQSLGAQQHSTFKPDTPPKNPFKGKEMENTQQSSSIGNPFKPNGVSVDDSQAELSSETSKGRTTSKSDEIIRL